jgi:hypothetical protein
MKTWAVASHPTAESIFTFQGAATWFNYYIIALKQLLSRRGQESTRVRNLKRDPDRILTDLVDELVSLKSVWSRCVIMDDEVISEGSAEPARPPAVTSTPVRMTFIRVGRQPPRLVDVVEVDSFTDDAERIERFPPTPSREVKVRLTLIGRMPPRLSEDLED